MLDCDFPSIPAGRRQARRGLLTTLLAALAVTACGQRGPGLTHIEGFAQGTTYALQWAASPAAPERAVAAEVAAALASIDLALSNYRPDSALERFNAARTTEPIAVPAELAELLQAARGVHGASAGCFDPTVRPLIALWGFDGAEPRVPAARDLEEARRQVGLEQIAVLADGRVQKLTPTAALDLSGIAQGHSADRLADILEERGVQRYLVEIGGEIVGRGRRPDGAAWRIAIEAPGEGGERRVLTLPERRTAIATSGTYQHFFAADGRVYPHVLDPRTGRPVEHSLVSVTVLGASAALADAWSTALLCLGPEAAMRVSLSERIAAVLLIERGETLEEWLSPSVATDWPGVL